MKVSLSLSSSSPPPTPPSPLPHFPSSGCKIFVASLPLVRRLFDHLHIGKREKESQEGALPPSLVHNLYKTELHGVE